MLFLSQFIFTSLDNSNGDDGGDDGGDDDDNQQQKRRQRTSMPNGMDVVLVTAEPLSAYYKSNKVRAAASEAPAAPRSAGSSKNNSNADMQTMAQSSSSIPTENEPPRPAVLLGLMVTSSSSAGRASQMLVSSEQWEAFKLQSIEGKQNITTVTSNKSFRNNGSSSSGNGMQQSAPLMKKM